MISLIIGILIILLLAAGVAMAAYKAQRKWGSRGLLVVWLASTVMVAVLFTGIDLTLAYYYSPNPIDPRRVLMYIAYQLALWGLFTGEIA